MLYVLCSLAFNSKDSNIIPNFTALIRSSLNKNKLPLSTQLWGVSSDGAPCRWSRMIRLDKAINKFGIKVRASNVGTHLHCVLLLVQERNSWKCSLRNTNFDITDEFISARIIFVNIRENWECKLMNEIEYFSLKIFTRKLSNINEHF